MAESRRNHVWAHEVKTVWVIGDKHAKARTHPTVAFERRIYSREITFTCERCKATVTEWHFPGRTPFYCAACGPIVKREKTAARTRRSRRRKKERAAARGREAEKM